ncbi:ABC transporter permease [Lysinibacillus sphaericus]|uniref:ABC transporter permease n=1 Tax=Lysinibacillus sphaericus TaxID=1421 RepID=UPI003F798873
MFTMRTIALKLFRAAWTHVLTSISIITIAICLVMTMSVYIWNADSQMKEDIQALFGEMDLMVGYNPEQDKLLTNEQIASFKSLPGVEEVSSVSLAHTTVENEEQSPIYTVGVENDDLVKSRYHFSVNLTPKDVIISENVAQIFNKQVGDTIHIETSDFTIQEILQPIKGTDSVNIILLPNDILKTWMDHSNEQTAAMFSLIKTDANVATSIGMEIKQLDETLRVDVASDYDFYKENLQALMIFMIVLSVFILLISSVLLLSTFQLLFYKIKEQLMVLRALGATSHQVKRIVQLQLSLIISFGVLVGMSVSILVIKLWLPQLISFMKLPSAKTELPVVFIIVIAVASFLLLQFVTKWQVQKSASLLPLQIATDNENQRLQWKRWKTIVISGTGVIALFLFVNAQVVDKSGPSALMILIGTLLLCGILLYMMPYLFTALLKISLKPIRKALGKEAYLACQQLMPQVRKNMPIVLSIIGLMVILIFGSSLFKTLQHNELAFINSQYETSLKIKNELNDPTITQDLIDEIESLPSVSYAYTESNYGYIALQIGTDWLPENYTTIDVEKFVQLGKLNPIEDDLKNGLIITENFAKKHQLSLGDNLTAGTYDNATQQDMKIGQLKIVGITSAPINSSDLMVDCSSFLTSIDRTIITDIMVEASDTEQAFTELAYLEERWPALQFSDKKTIIEQSNEMFFQRWSLFVGVFVILIAATCLGVLQTLLHSVYAKRGDYAIQRLIGLSPNGLMKLILTQVLSFVLYGLTVGILLGLLLTRMMAFIDVDAPMVYDFFTLGITSVVFLLATFVVFTLQGYWISRQKLANEMVDM